MLKHARPPIKAVAFDLDGTLVDSAPDLQAALNRVTAWAGRNPFSVDEVKGMVGDGTKKLIERALEASGGPENGDMAETHARWFARFTEEYQGCNSEQTRPYPGVVETLARLDEEGYHLGVCTNKPQAATIRILETFALSVFFDAVVGGDLLDNDVRKPDPLHLTATLDGLGVEPAEAVMVGDHLNDLACARGAGARVVLCTYGYSRVPVDTLGADAVIDRFSDLPDALASLA